MPFFNNPDLLTKERLKEDLRNNGIQIPTGNPAKSVLVDLYLTHLTAKNNDAFEERSEFSDDEPLTPKKSTRKRVIKKMSQKYLSTTPEGVDIDSLTDEELFAELKKLGVAPGPITGTTRSLYRKKLAKLLSNPSAQNTTEQQKLKRQEEEEEYSDNDEVDEEDSQDEEEVEEEGEEEMEVDESMDIDEPPSEKTVTVIQEAANTGNGKTIKTTTMTTTTTTIKKRAVKTDNAENEPAESQPVSNGHTVPKKPPVTKSKSSHKLWYFFIFLLILAVLSGVLLYHHMEENPLKSLPDLQRSTSTSGKPKAS